MTNREHSPPNLPLRRRAKKEAPLSDLIESSWTRFEQWTGRAIKVSIGLGTFITLLYFLRIRYTPLDGISSLAGLASAVALTSMLLFFSLVFLFGAPNFLTYWFAQTARATIGPLFMGTSRPSADANASNSVSVWRTMIWCGATIGLPWLAVFASSMPEVFVGAKYTRYNLWFACSLLAIAVAVTYRSSWAHSSFANKDGGNGNVNAVRQSRLSRMRFSGAFALVSSLPLLAYLSLFELSSFAADDNPLHEFAVVAFATVAVVFINALGVAFAFGKGIRPLVSILAQGIVVVMGLFFAVTSLGAWTGLQDVVMAAVSVRVSHASIVLNNAGCESLELQGFRSSAPASAASGAGDFCTLTDVTILSRLGSLWPVSFESKGDAARPPMLLVKSDNVVNVLVGAADCAATAASSPSTARRCLPVPQKP